MPRHRKMRRQLDAYLDGELTGRTAVAELERHLIQCPDCAGDAVTLERIKCALHRMGSRRPADDALMRLSAWTRGPLS